MYSSSDFSPLHSAGFNDTYSCVATAMRFFYSDPSICCEKFRQALEASAREIYGILNRPIKYKSIKRQIDDLASSIPYEFRNDKVVEEMHILRTIGNKYVHNSAEGSNPESDRLTCYCAMKSVAEWMVKFSEGYPEYLKARERNRKEKKERRKKRMKFIAKIVTTVATVAAAIAGVILGGKKSS